MSPEEINRNDGSSNLGRVMKFINDIEKDGYIFVDSKVAELTEVIGRGGEEPIRKYNLLKELETKISSINNEKYNFRNEMSNLLEELSNILSIVNKDNKFVDRDNKINTVLTSVRKKLGISQSKDRLASAEASKAKTKAAIDALDRNALSPEKYHAELKRLLFIYNGPNERTLNLAKNIDKKQEYKSEINLDIKLLDEISLELKELYDFLVISNLLPETKKQLVDQFNNIIGLKNKFKNTLGNYNSNLNQYQKTMFDLGISKASKLSNKKVQQPEPKKEEEPDVVKEEQPEPKKEEEPDVAVAEQPEPKKEEEPDVVKEEQLDPKKSRKARKVIEVKEPKNKAKIGKRAIAARLAAVAYVTSVIVPVSVLPPIGLIVGATTLFYEYRLYSLKKHMMNEKTIVQKAIELPKKLLSLPMKGLVHLAKVVYEKSLEPNITPEEKAELTKSANDIKTNLVDTLNIEKEHNNEPKYSEDEFTDKDISSLTEALNKFHDTESKTEIQKEEEQKSLLNEEIVSIKELMETQGLTQEEAVNTISETVEPNVSETSEHTMGGR